jgi:subtilase family serine protease
VPAASKEITLTGNTHPLLQFATDEGAVSAETKLDHMVLVLSTSAGQQAALDSLVSAQQDPSSPLYHQWLTPSEFGSQFGVGPAQIAQVSAWLQQQGFSVDEIPAGNRSIVFSGTAGQVTDTFHTEMRRYTVNGVSHLSNSQDPQIPAAFANVVSGLVSLHDFRRTPQFHQIGLPSTESESAPEYSSGATHYLFPADFATIYDLNPVYTAGTTGTGVSIAIAGRSNINLSDVAMFQSVAGLAANAPTVILPGTNPGLVTGDQMESTLDVEWSGAIASKAAVKLVAEPSTATSDGIDLASQYIVNHAVAPVVSVSYASCEASMGTSELAFYNALWEQAAVQGMSVFVASGDSGAAGCAKATATQGTSPAVNGMCSSPYATCVGGTEFKDASNATLYWSSANSAGYGSALSYIPETVWNESSLEGGTGLWSSGGGASTIYAQPTWQLDVAGAAAANGMRAVPDVSLNAAGHDGAMIVENGGLAILSGTSVSTPAFAGIMALVAQKTGTGQGSANPMLYKLAGAAPGSFHSIAAGNNTVPGVEGFTASGTTYNLATGLGSVDGSQLLTNWVTSTAPKPSLTLAASSDSLQLAAGGTASLSVSAATAGSFQGSVSYSVTGLPAGVTDTFSSSQLASASGGSELLTLSASNVAAAGSYTITVTASGDGLVSTQSIALTVTTACPRFGLVRMRCALIPRVFGFVPAWLSAASARDLAR